MDIDKDYILDRLESQVSGILKEEYIPKEKPIKSIFKIIYEPSFGQKVNCELFEGIGSYFLIKSTWDKEIDSIKLDIPLLALKLRYNKIQITPTIKREKIYIEKEIFDEILSKLSNTQISPIPNEDVIGCDGRRYQLRVGSLYNNCSFTWWEDGPGNWSQLTSEIMRVLNYFNDIAEIVGP